jgi:hypothetical protein
MHGFSDRIKHMGEHTPKHIDTKDPEFEELRAVYWSFAHECREVKLLAKRLQDDLRIMSKSYVDFGMETERYFLTTGDPMGPLFRSFTFLLRDQMRAVELGLGDTISAMELAINVNEGFRTRISHRDDVRENMDKWWKYREKGHKEEQKYMDYMKQYEEVNTLLKSELRTLRESTFRFKDIHLRKFIFLQRDAFRLLAQGAQELEVGLNLRPQQTFGQQFIGGQVCGFQQGQVQQQPQQVESAGERYGGASPVQGQSGSGIQGYQPERGGGYQQERGGGYQQERGGGVQGYQQERGGGATFNERNIGGTGWQQQQQGPVSSSFNLQQPGTWSTGGVSGVSGGMSGMNLGGVQGQQQIASSSSMSLGGTNLPILSKYLNTGGINSLHVPQSTQTSLYPTIGGGFVPATSMGGAEVGSGGRTTSSQ